MMRTFLAVLGSALFLVVAPGTVAGFLPWYISRWQFHSAFFGIQASRIAGIALIALALVPLLDSFARFALKGLGTPAPVFPTKRLVVTGFYQHVRNPMYMAVVSAVLGQALLFGDVHLLIYMAVIWSVMHLFVMFYEEPKLRDSFGEEYIAFCTHVPRWLPRLTPWNS